MAHNEMNAENESLAFLKEVQRSPHTSPETRRRVRGRRELDLSRAHLHHIPLSIGKCTNVVKIEAQSNMLSSLPLSLSNLHYLRVVDLHNNALTEFPIVLCGLDHLEELNLGLNKISVIPTDVNRLKRLRILNMWNNHLKAFPVALFGMDNLEELYLHHNSIRDAPVLEEGSKMRRLRIFDIRRNRLTAIPLVLCGISSLEELDLGENKITDVPEEIRRMKGLRILKIWDNALTVFPSGLCALDNLVELDLDDNKIVEVPEAISGMTNLETLKLNGNKISHLPHKIVDMECLKYLAIYGNPMVQPPSHIRRLDAIKMHFGNLFNTRAIRSSRIQVNFVGETGSGKTSISRTLQRGEPTLTGLAGRTKVVEQTTWEPEENIGFNINDFGGHNVYKIGYPIFISKSSLIFITFNLSKYNPDSEDDFQLYIGDWIDNCQRQLLGAQIAILGTHLDKFKGEEKSKVRKIRSAITKGICQYREGKQRWFEGQIKNVKQKIFEIDQAQTPILLAYQERLQTLKKSLNAQQMNITEKIFTVSSKTKEGVQQLHNYLTEYAVTNAVHLPERWVRIAKEICNKAKDGPENTLTLDSLKKEYFPDPSQNTDDEMTKAIYKVLRFLAHRGEIVWFKTKTPLKETIFHRQKVLVNLLKAILNHDTEEIRDALQRSVQITGIKIDDIVTDITMRGIISKRAMHCLWDPFNLEPREKVAMTELMQELDLCYLVEEGEPDPASTTYMYHFPWLCTDEQPSELDAKWPKRVPSHTTQLTFRIQFPYRCPEGLYERFSVRQHKYLESWMTERMDWKDGAYVEVDGCKMQFTRHEIQQQAPRSAAKTRDWAITISIRGTQLPNMWKVLKRAHCDVMTIISEDWLGLAYEDYLLCPHCVREGLRDPSLFPGQLIKKPPTTTHRLKAKCKKYGVEIDADLVYPPSWKTVLLQNQDTLAENITEPCLRNMLNHFIEADIISDREAQFVKAEPPQLDDQPSSSIALSSLVTRPRDQLQSPGQHPSSTSRVVVPEKTIVLLDILRRKCDRAYHVLCQCLNKEGEADLLRLIK